jgi:hypothetical protein
MIPWQPDRVCPAFAALIAVSFGLAAVLEVAAVSYALATLAFVAMVRAG